MRGVALAGNSSRRTATLSAAEDGLEMLDLSRAFDPGAREQPWSAYSLYLPEVCGLLQLPAVFKFKVFYCSFGTLYQKPTALLTNVAELVEVSETFRPCTCPRPHPVRLEWAATTAAAVYPRPFAKAVANIFQGSWPGDAPCRGRASLSEGGERRPHAASGSCSAVSRAACQHPCWIPFGG